MGRIKYMLITALLMVSCGRSGNTVIDGSLAGYNEKTIWLDRITLNSEITVDSTFTDEKGRFRFRFKQPDTTPGFYNLRYDKGLFTLLLSPGERVNINSLGNYARNYTVEGSNDSELVKELNAIMGSSFYTLDSLSRQLERTPDFDIVSRQRIFNEYETVYVRQKQEMIRFIVHNSTSLASLYALYQRLPNSARVFDRNDILYMKLVYDSLSVRYPDSPNVLSLKKDIEQIENESIMAQRIRSAMASPTPFPDLNLPDMPGNRIKLSSIKDKVILLDFWATGMPNSAFHNAELMEIYSDFFNRGFEIYQVSLDTSKSAWVTAISEQKPPWISVCDFMGADSPAAGSYNITRLPSNFLIDRQGNIVARDVSLEALPEELNKLITN